MPGEGWTKECPLQVMILDQHGKILQMNDRFAKVCEDDGGMDLVGKNVYDCHPEPARSKLREMVESQQPKYYTTERAGVKEMIALVPWFRDGVHAGLAHIAFEIPKDLPHFVRDAKPQHRP